MALVSKTSASLRFFGDDLSPDNLTLLLGKTPSRCSNKGDEIRGTKTGKKRIAKTGSWILCAADCGPGDLDAQIEELLVPLSKDLSVWRSLRKFKPNVFVGLFLVDSNEMLETSPETFSLLADRGITLTLDVYGR